MEPQNSLPFSREHTPGPYPEPDAFGPHLSTPQVLF